MARRRETDDSELNFSRGGWKIESMDDYFSLLFSLDKIQKIFELRLNDGLPAFSERDGRIVLNVYPPGDLGELRGHQTIIRELNNNGFWNALAYFSSGPMPFQGMHANDQPSAIDLLREQRSRTVTDTPEMAGLGRAFADVHRGETDPAVSYGDPRCTYKMAQDFYKHLNALIIQTQDKSEAEKHEVLMKLGGVALGCFLDRNTVPHDLMEPFVCKHLLGLGVMYPPFPHNAIRFLRVTDKTNTVWAFPHMTLDEIDTILTTMTGKPKFEALSLLAGSLSVIGAIKHVGPENVPDKLIKMIVYAGASLKTAALTCSAIAGHTVSLAARTGSALTSPTAAGVFGAIAAVAVVDKMTGGRAYEALSRRLLGRANKSAKQKRGAVMRVHASVSRAVRQTKNEKYLVETREMFLRKDAVIAARTMDIINAAIQVLGLKIQSVDTLAPFTSRPGCMVQTETPPEESPPSDSEVRELCRFKPGGNERRSIPPVDFMGIEDNESISIPPVDFMGIEVQRQLEEEESVLEQFRPRALRARPRRTVVRGRPALDGPEVAVDRDRDALNSRSSSSSSETRTGKPMAFKRGRDRDSKQTRKRIKLRIRQP